MVGAMREGIIVVNGVFLASVLFRPNATHIT